MLIRWVTWWQAKKIICEGKKLPVRQLYNLSVSVIQTTPTESVILSYLISLIYQFDIFEPGPGPKLLV